MANWTGTHYSCTANKTQTARDFTDRFSAVRV
jgi:hypothetical protein